MVFHALLGAVLDPAVLATVLVQATSSIVVRSEVARTRSRTRTRASTQKKIRNSRKLSTRKRSAANSRENDTLSTSARTSQPAPDYPSPPLPTVAVHRHARCIVCNDEVALLAPGLDAVVTPPAPASPSPANKHRLSNERDAPVPPGLEIGVVFPPCRHEYCSSCLLQWLSTTVADRTLQFPTKCAHEACPATLSAVHAESLLFNPAYHNLREKYGLRILESEGRVVTCPQPNCCATIILPDQSLRDLAADDLSILCTACNSIMCARCNVPDHWPRPCANVQAEIDCKIDAPVLLLAKENKWKRCPNCQAIVERRDGCNHVKCLCGTGFCFQCTVPYRDDERTPLHPHGRPGCTCGLFNFRAGLALLVQPGAVHARPARPPRPVVRRAPKGYPARDTLLPGELHHRRMSPSYAREIRNGLRDHYRHGRPLRIHALDIIRGIPPRQVLPPCVGRTVHGPAWEDSDSDEYVLSSDDDDGSSSGDDDLPPEPKRLFWTWKRNRFGRRIMACGTGEVLHPDKSTARLPKWLERTYRRFTCHYCTEPFRTWPMLVDHFHTTRAHEVYMCCGRTFEDANGFICHLDHVHEGCPDYW